MALNEVPRLRLSMASKPVEATPEPVRFIPESKLKLFRGSVDAGKYVSSPFVTKIEFRLRLADVPYALDAGAPWLGPKGKIPYVEVAPETKSEKPLMLGDSTLIFTHLMGDNTVSDLNANLTRSEKSRDLGLRSLLEDKLYFYHVRTQNTPRHRHEQLTNTMATRCANAGSTTTTSNASKRSGPSPSPSASSSATRFTRR